jgi:hypothetical protein
MSKYNLIVIYIFLDISDLILEQMSGVKKRFNKAQNKIAKATKAEGNGEQLQDEANEEEDYYQINQNLKFNPLGSTTSNEQMQQNPYASSDESESDTDNDEK